MKTRIRQLFQKPPPIVEDFVNVADSTAAKTRIKIVSSIVNAWWAAATPANCASAFAKAGIYPYSLERVLSNKFVRPSGDNEVEHQENGVKINGEVITADAKRIEIAKNFYKRDFASIDDIPQYTSIQLYGDLSAGYDCVFSGFPRYQHFVLPGVIFQSI